MSPRHQVSLCPQFCLAGGAEDQSPKSPSAPTLIHKGSRNEANRETKKQLRFKFIDITVWGDGEPSERHPMLGSEDPSPGSTGQRGTPELLTDLHSILGVSDSVSEHGDSHFKQVPRTSLVVL